MIPIKNSNWECSVCGHFLAKDEPWRFCPCCGLEIEWPPDTQPIKSVKELEKKIYMNITKDRPFTIRL